MGRIFRFCEAIWPIYGRSLERRGRLCPHRCDQRVDIAEGAGATTRAAAAAERAQCAGRRIGIILSGGNIDLDRYREILAAG